MKTYHGAVVALALFIAPVGAHAAEAKIALTVHNASCALCPAIIKGALQRVKGVSAVAVGDANAQGDVMTRVTYDDAQASPETLIKATTDQGYPAETSNKTSS